MLISEHFILAGVDNFVSFLVRALSLSQSHYVIYLTRATVFHRDIQTPRRELKIRRAAEYF